MIGLLALSFFALGITRRRHNNHYKNFSRLSTILIQFNKIQFNMTKTIFKRILHKKVVWFTQWTQQCGHSLKHQSALFKLAPKTSFSKLQQYVDSRLRQKVTRNRKIYYTELQNQLNQFLRQCYFELKSNRKFNFGKIFYLICWSL